MQIRQQKAHQLPKQLVRYVFPCETLGEMCYFIILLTQLSLLKQFAQKRGQKGQHRCYQKEQAQRPSVENVKIAVAHNQGAHEVLLRHAAQDDADNDGRHGKAQLIEEVT